MKKLFLLCAGVLLGLVVGCSSNSSSDMEAEILEAYELGKQDAINAIKEEASNDYSHYANVEKLEEVIVDYFGNDDYAYEIRDCVLWHPDIEFYESTDLIDKYIEDSQITDLNYEMYPAIDE